MPGLRIVFLPVGVSRERRRATVNIAKDESTENGDKLPGKRKQARIKWRRNLKIEVERSGRIAYPKFWPLWCTQGPQDMWQQPWL